MSNLYRRANTTADVASSFMRTSKGVSPAMGAARGYKAGTVFEQRNRELSRREDTDQFNRAAYWGKLKRDAKVKERETAGGMAAIASGNTREAYKAVQDSGKHPLLDTVTYDELVPYAQMTPKGSALIKQGKADDLVKFEKGQKIAAAELAERKQTEVERNNRAQNDAAKTKARQDAGGERGKAVDEKTIRQIIINSGQIDRTWDVLGSKWVIKDAEVDKKVKALATKGIKLFNDNQGMSLNEAADKALRSAGYTIKTGTGDEAGPFAGNEPQNEPKPVRTYDPQSRTLR